MSETTVDPSAEAAGTDATAAQTAAEALEPITVDIPALLEAGVHFGHQTQRWNPKMRHYIFGERNGIHIVDLDQSLPMLQGALDYIRDVTAAGGKVLFVATKKQAAPLIKAEAARAGQYYVNNRWLGGMLTNWKTVKKSIERYKALIELLGDEERRNELSKKEQARLNRQREKYEKSLEGMKEMSRLPDVLFIVDVGRESIAVTEARRLGIPIVGVVDTNCNPDNIDFVVPGNDDSIRAISLYCRAIAQACIEGAELHQQKIVSDEKTQPGGDAAGAAQTGRRVVEIKQQPRRGRGGDRGGSGGGGRAHSAGGRSEGQEAAPAPEASATPAGEPAAPAPAPEAAPAAAPEGDAEKA
ncbi:MAG: 30S ribosomal protein S2 [Myxococcota bacterium]